MIFDLIKGIDYSSYSAGSSPRIRGRHVSNKPIYLSPPFAQIKAELTIDNEKKILIVHLTNAENIPKHPVFNTQSEYFIHIQLLNNKTYKKFYDLAEKRRSNLSINTWKNLQEKSTK